MYMKLQTLSLERTYVPWNASEFVARIKFREVAAGHSAVVPLQLNEPESSRLT
jgi:hypothetical protein